MKSINDLCDIVRQTAYDIHVYHANGHLEKVYENALAHRLRKLGLDVKQQHPLKVYDEDGTEIGDYLADLLVENRLIVELKAAKTIADEYIAQTLGYLNSFADRTRPVDQFWLVSFPNSEICLESGQSERRRSGPSGLPDAVFLCVLCVLSRPINLWQLRLSCRSSVR